MPTTTVQEIAGGQYDLLPEDTLFLGELQSVKEKTITPKDTSKAPFTKWVWEFRVVDGEHAGRLAWGETWSKVTMGDREGEARLWIEALLRRQLDVGEEINTDSYIGLKAQFEVGRRSYETGSPPQLVTRGDIVALYPLEDQAQSNYPY